jgi:hypothetical protein
MPNCNKPIGHLSTRTGKMIYPTISWSCELVVGHEGPCVSASDAKSVKGRAVWDAGARDRAAQGSQLAKLQGGVPQRVGAIDPDTGAIGLSPGTLLPCPFCHQQVAYSNLVTHVFSHTNRNTTAVDPAPDGSVWAEESTAAPSPSHLATQPSTGRTGPLAGSGPAPRGFDGEALRAVLEWTDHLEGAVPPSVAEAIQALRPFAVG